jgi:hypothetical protein
MQSAIDCQRFGFFQMAACVFLNDPLYSRKYNEASNITAKKTTTLAKAAQS